MEKKIVSRREKSHPGEQGYRESYERIVHEGDIRTRERIIQIDKVTVKKKIEEIGKPLKVKFLDRNESEGEADSKGVAFDSFRKSSSPSPLTVRHNLDKFGQNGTLSKSSSAASVGRESEGSLRRTPSREQIDWDSSSVGSATSSSKGSEWYQEYQSQSFQNYNSKLERVLTRQEYDSHIAEIRDEQERVQKKTFVNWINSYLSKRNPPLRINDLIEDLKDGTKLLALLEVLSGETLQVERGRNLRRPHFLSNANTALQFLLNKKIKLVNINASDLVDGRPPVVLGLIWTIILYFQIEENARALESLGHTFGGSASSLDSMTEKRQRLSTPTKSGKIGARRALLQWVTNALPKDLNIEIKDFGPSWRDGIAFLGVIEAIRSGLIDIEALKNETNKVRLETAFDVAETELGVARLLDPEDVDVDRPDERSIMTYVAQFLHRYPEPKTDTLENIQNEYAILLNWLLQRTQYLQHMIETNTLPLSYKEYTKFLKETVDKSDIYEKMGKLVNSQGSIHITMEAWREIERLWLLLESQLRHWEWLLDSQLTGTIGEIAEWLSAAEKLIYSDTVPQAMNEETAGIISRKLEHHKLFFSELSNIVKKFDAFKLSSEVGRMDKDHLASIERRLSALPAKAAQRRIKLKFLEHKCCLIAFLHLTETKLKGWTIKYGREDKVQHLLDQYRNFVSRNRIFQEFNKAFIDMQQVVEEYKREGDIDAREGASIDQFMRNTSEKWRSVSMELRCVQSMLEEVLAYWRRWNTSSQEFQDWLERAYGMVDQSEEEKMEFFQDLTVWKDKHQQLNDTVSFLVATSDDVVVEELKEQFGRLNSLWERLFPTVKQYMQAGDILRQRKDYGLGIEKLQKWLRTTEEILTSTHLTSSESVKNYGEELKKLQSEIEGIEELFKEISKKFQSLIPDLSRDEVDVMMSTLKKEKEALVRVRALIPMQLHLYHQILIQQESLEAGQTELAQWLDNAEKLLQSHDITQDVNKLRDLLEKHKQFFSRTLYYRSMLDSKNKVYQNIVKNIDQSGGSLPLDMGNTMKEINERFVLVTQRASQWEQKLNDTIRCWDKYIKMEESINEWLRQAENMTNEKHVDIKIVEQQKKFFARLNENAIHDLIVTAEDLKNCLPIENQASVIRSVENLEKRWREMLSYAPLHLMKLDFRLDEGILHSYLNEMEKELSAEQAALDRSDDVSHVTARSKQFFHDKKVITEVEKCLENLGKISVAYTQRKPKDTSLKEAYAKAISQWETMMNKASRIKSQLEQVPVQWSKYRKQFQDLVHWMDSVDENITNILKQMDTLEEFEKERNSFQMVCKEVESKREAIKWLVQTLDGLISRRNDEEAQKEQKLLESLIARYKALIPNIEMTVTQTELYSKCYIYRKEAKDVCDLLKRVGETSELTPHPETLNAVSQMINQQEAAITQLDLQRPNIISMLQRGRELSKDPHAPQFVSEEVSHLENSWNKTYNTTLEKLNKLKATEKVWKNYKDQKREIIELLERAEQELMKVKGKPSRPTDILEELKEKQELSKSLRVATEELLRKLRELCSTLSSMTAPERKPLLQKEITEVEHRLQTTLETVQDRVVFLEQLNGRWIRFNSDLSELQEWMKSNAPEMVYALESTEIGPEERLTRAHILKAQIAQKTQILDLLDNQAQELIENDGNPESEQLRKEILSMKESIKSLKTSADEAEKAGENSVAIYERFKIIVELLTPWLEKAEMKMSPSPKPATAKDAEEQLKKAKLFINDCSVHSSEFKELMSLKNLPLSAMEESDVLKTKYQNIMSHGEKEVQRLEHIISLFNEFEKPTNALEIWVEKKEKEFAEEFGDSNVIQMPKLEKELEKLKIINNEIASKQMELANISSICDAISQIIAIEGSTILKNRIQDLKRKITELADFGRLRMNKISDAIIERQEFNLKLDDFNTWVIGLNSRIKSIEIVPIADIDLIIQRIHTLLQDHGDKQSLFDDIYQQIKSFSMEASPSDAKELEDLYTTLVTNYQGLENNLKEKKVTLEKWNEFLSFHSDMFEQIKHLAFKTQDIDLNLEKLMKLSQEIKDLKEKIKEWKVDAELLDSSCEKYNLHMKDDSGASVTAVHLLGKFENQLENVDEKLKERFEKIQNVQSHLNNFEELRKKIIDDLREIEEKRKIIMSELTNSKKFDITIKEISNLRMKHDENHLGKEKLHKEGLSLMRMDQSHVEVIEKTLTSIESEWDRISEKLIENLRWLSEMSTTWDELLESEHKLNDGIQEIRKVLVESDKSQVLDSAAAIVDLGNAKKCFEIVRKLKSYLTIIAGKAQHIAKNVEDLNNINMKDADDVLVNAQKNWKSIHDDITNRIQNLEAQIVLWEQIENGKNNILTWLKEMKENLTILPTGPEAQIKLNKYKDEYQTYLNKKIILEERINQLIGLNKDKNHENLRSLMRLLDEEFQKLQMSAQYLEEVSSKFGEKEQIVRKEIKSAGDILSQIRESVVSCDDLTGDIDKILQRLNRVRNYRNDLMSFNEVLKKIKDALEALKREYPGSGDAGLTKELSCLEKRYDSVISHANKIENNFLTFLKKYYTEKFGTFHRNVTGLNEKLQWCLPESNNDEYNLKMKLSSLKDVEAGIKDCENRKNELEEDLRLLEKVEGEGTVEELTIQKEKIFKELKILKEKCDDIGEKLRKKVSLWEKYEDSSEAFSTWLKDKEAKIRSESYNQLELTTIPHKYEESKIFEKELMNHEPDLEELLKISEEIMKDSPESRVGQHAQQLQMRHQAAIKFVTSFIERLQNLRKNNDSYNESVKEVKIWLTDSEKKLKQIEDNLGKSARSLNAFQKQVEELKEFEKGRDAGLILLNSAVEKGEALFAAIIPDNRETIRSELRALRNISESLLDRANAINKRIEAVVMQRSSFDDSYSQVEKWLRDARSKLGPNYELKPTLQEKKSALHGYKALQQEILSHKNILSQLQEKIGTLSDEESGAKLEKMLVEYEKLLSMVEERIRLEEQNIVDHEKFLQSLEKLHDWLETLKAEASPILCSVNIEKEEAVAQLETLENIIRQKPEGEELIKQCKEKLTKAMEGTEDAGKITLIKEFDDENNAWLTFFKECCYKQGQLNSFCNRFTELETKVEEISNWLKNQEMQIKDQSLRSTAAAKEQHLQKLKELEKEMLSEQPTFNTICEECKNVESDSELAGKISKLLTRYQNLKGLVRESIGKYEGSYLEHKIFDENFVKFEKWLNQLTENLESCKEIVGDVGVLQERQKKLSELGDLKTRENTSFDKLLDSGEKLYNHTSPDGREIIRQQLRSLRNKWDSFGEDIQRTMQKLDECLVQFADFALQQEQLTNWLRGIEKAMQQHTELKNSLQEKKAQLQNHRIVHQEIAAHQSLVEGVCDKAKRLVEQTKDTSLNVYLQSIKKLFQDIVIQSQLLLENLENYVDNDTKFTEKCDDFRNWLLGEKEKFIFCSEIGGEKNEFTRRLIQVKELQENLKIGDEKIKEVEELLIVMKKSTAPKGIKIAGKDLNELKENLNQYKVELGGIEKKIEDSLQEWKNFEDRLDEHTKWFRAIEAVFREQKLFNTLPEKQTQLENFRQQRALVTDREKIIDEFVDKSHVLLNSSGTERIKPLISQISNRYQLIHVLSKEVINRWEGLVDAHKAYEEKFIEIENWLTSLEKYLNELNGDCDLRTEMAILERLLSEKDQGAHKLTGLNVLAEKLYPDTAAPGREQIRSSLRLLRDRWDKLEEGIIEQQKKQEAATQQLTTYQESLNQTLGWLATMEATLNSDPGSWTSTQEIRSKLSRNKATLQEVLCHKKIIENLVEKANVLKGTLGHWEKSESIAEIGGRYEKLVDGLLKNITQLEDSLTAFQAFNDLLKKCQDHQKHLWDLLIGYSDYSGNKSALEARLGKINELEEGLPEAELNSDNLKKLIAEKTDALPFRAKEAMERDLTNLMYDQKKFSDKVKDVKHGLEERLRQWNEYDESFDHLLSWLAESEAALKNYSPKSTLQEKQELLQRYQDLVRQNESFNVQLSELITLADHLEQSLILSIRQNETDLDKISDASSDLSQISGETRVSVNVQQLTSRFQSVQATAKDIVKKCEEAVECHKAYLEKYKQCSDWLVAANSRFEKIQSLPTANRVDLDEKSHNLKELLHEQPTAISLVNSAVEMGEKLYPQTALEGREIVRKQLEELHNALEMLFDGVTGSERELQANLSKWSGFEESSQQLLKWLQETEKNLPDELELKTTLDEKRSMLMNYRSILHDINSHQQDIVALKGQLEALPERNSKVDQQFKEIFDRHEAVLKKAGSMVERYEEIVSFHQQYSKAVMDLQEWLDATHNTIQLWGETELERISLHTNLERLKNLQGTLPEEEPRIEEIRKLAEKVIPGTIVSGQSNIRAQVDSSQQEWQSLRSTIKMTIDTLENKLQQWIEYEQLKDHCLSWLRETDTKLHAVDLKATINEKRDQLEELKKLQGEIRAKELEIDSITEKAHQLSKGRSSLVSELGVKYQQICQKVKDMTGRWHQYVSSHQELESRAAECFHWLEEIRGKLAYCSDLSASSQKDLENKLETIQDLLLYKEEGFSKVQGIVELAQAVLANTAPRGHDTINEMLARLQEEWSSIASKMIEIKAILDDSIHRWAGFLEQIQELKKTVEYLECGYKEHAEFKTTMSEKRAQLDRIKSLDEKARCEKVEVDGLRAKSKEMLASGQQSHAASQAKEILDKFDTLVDNIKRLFEEREDQYRDHRLYKEAHDDLVGWLSRAREKVPSLKQRPLSDKLALESAVAPLDALLNKQAQGELLVEHLHNTGEVVIASTSEQGQTEIKNEIRALTESFHGLFKQIAHQKSQMEAIVIQWRSFKEEYERLSDWLQQIDILVKAQKIALLSTVAEKGKQVEEVKDILHKLEMGKSQIDLFNEAAATLLESHLDSYVNNQLRHLNSRYQVQINLAKDVFKKVETNYEQHKEYEENLKKARNWIENAKEIVWSSSENASLSTSKEELESRLDKIQELLNKREEGQNFVHMTMNCGEKVLRNTKSDGRDVINNQLKELQTDWDRLVRKISTAKVNLETGLLQWADYSSSYSQLQQWITDREAKLQEVCEQKVVKAKKGQSMNALSNLSIGERKATLRQTDSIVQDIVSFEPMIQSVASKAEDLLQAKPACEISTKYETLSKQAKELYAKQKETVEQHEAFIDAGNEFLQWIRTAKVMLGKCSDPTGDKESLNSKAAQLTILHSELPEGQQKLEKALAVAAQVCQIADDEDKDIIEEEVALLQEELDTHLEALSRTRQLVEAGIERWREYEEQYKEACSWLAQTETLVQGFNKLQDSLEEKKIVLEQFQANLQTLFDWQKEMDRLNMKAQSLLETCADTRVSNAVTQITTKYNALLSMAKEVMRRLELHYQEHQQHSSLYQECQDWAERTRDKLNECAKPVSTLPDAQTKLQSVKAIRQSLETGQNKLRYALELKEKVIMNTEQSGAAKIQEDTENLKSEFDRLFNDVDELRTKLGNRLSQLEDLQKSLRLLTDWLEEAESKANGNDVVLNDLSEKKALLEKYKILQKDINSHKESIMKIQEKLKEDPSLTPKEFEVCKERFNNLANTTNQKIEVIEKQVQEHMKYKQAYIDACDWVRKTRIEIQQCSDPHGEREETVKKEQKLKEIMENLSVGENLMDSTLNLSEEPIKTSGPEGKDTIKQELNQLKNDWEYLNYMCKDSQKTLSKCLSHWKEFSETYDRMSKWLSDCEKRIEKENEKGEKRTPEDLQIARDLHTEATNQKMVLEELNDRCENLMEMCACIWVRDKTVQLQAKYTQLLTAIQILLSHVEKNLSDHTEFIKARDEFADWLKRSHGTIQDSIGFGDEAKIRDRFETVKVVGQRLTEGQLLMGKMQTAFAKVVEMTTGEQEDALREDVANLKASWEQLTMDLNSVQAQLKSQLRRWEDFNENLNNFKRWLSETEDILKEVPNTKGELGEMKTQMEKLKHGQGEIDEKGVEITTLMKESQQLSDWANNKKFEDEVKKLKKHWETLLKKCKNRQDKMEKEIADYCAYHQKLQDTEKWLLQISFQLMAHNSLYINSREQTEEQIAQHESLLGEIQNYQTNLDDLKGKGRAQIERYVKSTPTVKSDIEKQLTNVQDSYDSLLNTAIQIKNRLLESLAKFKEYEDALELIAKNLDILEGEVTKEIEIPVTNPKDARSHIEISKDLNNRLQTEKNRLAAAIQACEAAAACISRPSSPLEAMPSASDKELAVRARLDDLIDQIQMRLTKLEENLVDMEAREKHRKEEMDWIMQQKIVVNDWKQKPAKLRADSAKQELNAMNDLKRQIYQKRNEEIEFPGQIKSEEEFGLGEMDSDLEKEYEKLEKELAEVISKREESYQMTEDYRASMAEAHKWLDSIVKRMENLEKGSPLNFDCYQKLKAIQDLVAELDAQGNQKVEDVKKQADQVAQIVSNLESQQISEQLKSLERRENDIAKRVQRKAQMLEATKKNFEKITQEIQQLRKWIALKMDDLKTREPVGFQSKQINEKLQELKALMKEVDGKQVLIESLEKRIGNLAPEIEPSEIQQLESQLKSLSSEHCELTTRLRGEMDLVNNAGQIREKFETDLEGVKNWMKNKFEQINKTGRYLPLKSQSVQLLIIEYKEYEDDIEKFGEKTLKDLEKQVNGLMKDSSEEDKPKLKMILSGLMEEYDRLRGECHDRLKNLGNLLENRKQLEEDLEKCEKWFDEAQVATSIEIRKPNVSVLENQQSKYEKLMKDAENIGKQIDKDNEQAKSIYPTLNEADKLTLESQMNGLKDKYARITGVIKDRQDSTKGMLEQYKDAARKVQESMDFMTKIQNEVKELNRPVSAKVEEVQGMLDSYEKILGELKQYRGGMGDVEGDAFAELASILSQQDALIRAIEDQIARLRQLLLLREQFMALIQQITTFIAKYTEIVRDIETGGHTVQEKIRKYDEVIVKIQECEGLLTSASDKGQRIAAEGSATDRNSVTETLTSLKQQLLQLRKAVERQREQHEKSLAAYGKLAEELDEVLDALHSMEGEVKSRPLLLREPESVDSEIINHKTLAEKVEQLLNKIRKIQDATKNESGLPGSLLEKLSEANSLVTTLPMELNDRFNYLENNRNLRLEYKSLKDRLEKWIREAEEKIQKGRFGVDFEAVFADLEDHKAFFSSEQSMLDLLSHIQHAGDKVWPSLSQDEQEELSKELQLQNQRLKNTLNNAKSRRAQLEQDCEIWREFVQCRDKVNSVLARTKFVDEPVENLAGLHFNIQKLTHALNDINNQQTDLDYLNDKATEIEKQADAETKEKLKEQMKDKNDDWKNLVNDLESRRETLSNLAQHWEQFENQLQTLENNLSRAEEKGKLIDMLVRSRSQLEETLIALSELLKVVEDYSDEITEVKSSFGPIRMFLEASSPSAMKAIDQKLANLQRNWKDLMENLQGKKSTLSMERKKISYVTKEIGELVDRMNNLKKEISGFYVFEEDEMLSSSVSDVTIESKKLCSDCREYYNNGQQFIPNDINQELTNMELLAESVSSSWDEKCRERQRAKAIREEYFNDVEFLKNWLQKAGIILQDRSKEPQQLKQQIEDVESQIPNASEILDRARKNGQIIIDSTTDDAERQMIATTVDSLKDDLQQVKACTEQTKQLVDRCLESWEIFMTLYKTVMSWAAEKRLFLAEPLQLSSLTEARQKLNDYSTAAKSCKTMGKNLRDMSKEMEAIANVGRLSDLPDKLIEAEEAKTEMESSILERNVQLSETCEEWEQCEKKLKDVRSWLEKSRSMLESPTHKNRPLRDQLAGRERILTDINNQKTKISLSLEKLHIHFRSGIGGDKTVVAAAEDILQELDQLTGDVKDQMSNLEECIAQVDQYQQEIQSLRQQIAHSEQQLRATLSPALLSQDRERAHIEQEALQERVKLLQCKMSARMERIKLLSARGTPDLEPLKDPNISLH